MNYHDEAQRILFQKFQEFFHGELGETFKSKFPYSTYLQCFTSEDYLERLISWHARIYGEISRDSEPIGTILDYGSGFGFAVFCLAAFEPRNKLIGIEIVPERVEFSNKLREAYFEEYDIEFICSDKPRFQENINAALLENVLSHIKLPVKCLHEIVERMNYGARIHIADNNSGLALRTRRHNRRIWKAHEPGQVAIRVDIFQRLLKDVAKGTIQEFAELSSGLGAEDIEALVKHSSTSQMRKYLVSREQPNPTFYIEERWVDEKIVHPIVYREILRDMGFERLRCKSAWLSMPKKIRFMERLISAFPRISGRIFPHFILTGEKRRL